MNIRDLSAGLSFEGKVPGRRQTYYVFSSPGAFFVFSFSRAKPKAGYFNMVTREAHAYVRRLTRGRVGVTSQDVNKRARTRKHVGSALEALNVLYVMVALGEARIDKRHTGIQLFFNVSD
jgi:hypothetical protein